jgi:hypothetical protein
MAANLFYPPDVSDRLKTVILLRQRGGATPKVISTEQYPSDSLQY